MANIRQRRAPSPSRDSFGGSSTSWEIATEGSGDKAHSSTRKTIPMYNPIAMQSPLSQSNSTLPPQFSSSTPSNNARRDSWNTVMQATNRNLKTYHDPPEYYADSIKGKGGGYDLLRSGRSLPSMSPKLIPDSAYRAYLSGKPAVKTKKPMIDKITLVKIAGGFSIVGFIFLTFVGILIDTQPMFMQGILTKNEEYSSNGKKTKTFYAISISERLEPAKHAYRGAFLYLLVAIGCLGYAHNMHHFLFKKGWQQYRDIDDVDSTVATFHRNGDGKKDFLPTNGPRKAYEDHNGILFRVWHSTSIRLQQLGFYLESIWQARRRKRRFAGAKDV